MRGTNAPNPNENTARGGNRNFCWLLEADPSRNPSPRGLAWLNCGQGEPLQRQMTRTVPFRSMMSGG